MTLMTPETDTISPPTANDTSNVIAFSSLYLLIEPVITVHGPTKQ